MENLYNILEVDSLADEKQIKVAYAKMVRKYPPEKAPEQFKKIREAYEILINPLRRAEYIARSKYGNKINELEKKADDAVENGEYYEAVNQYKKILIIEPSLSYIKNKLALTFLYNGQTKEGINQLEELVRFNSKNSVYLGNLGYAYKKNGDIEKAEEYLIKSLCIDGKNEENVSIISDIYIEQNEYNKAVQYLRKAAETNKTYDFREFIYYYEIIRVCTFSKEISIIEETMNYMCKIIPNDKETKNYVLGRFYYLAKSLYKMLDYISSKLISKKTIEICGDNETVKKIYEESKRLLRLTEKFNKLLEDDRIIGILKTPIYYYLYRFRLSNSQYERDAKENINQINNAILLNNKDMFDSVHIIKEEYLDLYDLKRDLYDEINDKICNIVKEVERDF
ncbi:J domain-containing protein [Clostridium acidisoli]|uniref:J domain-containing protein n=1 Tax=Clostridium acidisoli TaxID=91624 RepID=UPI001594C620|nr:DnaJ domain-containing protein [Clostridium acidisoli]